jgi:hypothetical protein
MRQVRLVRTAVWLDPLGLSGIDASAATTQAETVPSATAP